MKPPPSDIALENSLLSTCLTDPTWDSYYRAQGIVCAADFFSPPNGQVFSELAEMSKNASSPDATVLAARIRSKGTLAAIGGVTFLVNLMAEPVLSDIESAAAKIRVLAKKRTLIRTCQEIAAQGYEACGDEQVFLDDSATRVSKIAEEGTSITSVSSMLEATQEFVTELENRQRGASLDIPTGLPKLDYQLGQLKPNELVILAARPGMGKTSLAMQVALSVATTSQQEYQPASLFFSLEMPRAQLAGRAISAQAQMPLSEIRKGKLSAEDFAKAADLVATPLLKIDDNPIATINDIRTRVRKVAREISGYRMDDGRPCRLSLVAVDYLQLVTPLGGKNNNREQDVSEISRGLKLLSKEFELCVVALSQLNRAVETRPNKRPLLSDLRDSGAVEQDADVVLFVYRDDYYNPQSRARGQSEILIAKNRNGATGVVHVGFHAPTTRFYHLENPIVLDEQPARRSRWEGRKAANDNRFTDE